jgi:branched-chain amino acid transport system ATP-binding protein
MTLLVIEHMMDLLVGLSDRLIILSAGQKIAEGDPNEVVANKTVRDVYIG